MTKVDEPPMREYNDVALDLELEYSAFAWGGWKPFAVRERQAHEQTRQKLADYSVARDAEVSALKQRIAELEKEKKLTDAFATLVFNIKFLDGENLVHHLRDDIDALLAKHKQMRGEVKP